MHLIARYETMLLLSQDMLVAAERGDWLHLAALEQKVTELRLQLEVDDPPSAEAWAALSPEWREHKAELITRILDLDRQIRCYAEPQLESLRKLLAGENQARRVAQAYGSVAR